MFNQFVLKSGFFIQCFLLMLPILGLGAGGAGPVGNFGPTGLDIEVLDDGLIKVIGVQEGSPAEGKIALGTRIESINGFKLPAGAHAQRVQLAKFITLAEATDGKLAMLKRTDSERDKMAEIRIPVLGSYGRNWPVDCLKTEKIIRANAEFIAEQVKNSDDGFTGHSLYNGLAILMLLSTGQEQDLDVVRGIYKRRMAEGSDSDTGPHSWHNGYQGIAVCEYYLRTGDKSVMPLIDAICDSARKYQANGGWSHWATSLNPQYTAGGLMNAAGTQILTTLLLAESCGADVDRKTLLSALKYFYRFAGHGNNPYGDHRPEGGYGSDNGKNEMLAIAMSVAARASEGRTLYGFARDKCAHVPLYSYREMLRGHTGGGLGATWHGIAAAWMMEKEPELYRNRMDDCQWFYELSRRFDGSFGICGGGRYDKIKYGYAMGLSLTAPMKTLQITGAPKSRFAKSVSLPARPWGRQSDARFLAFGGGALYQRPVVPPHVEYDRIAEADEAGLEALAYHPEAGYREVVADTIREKKLYGLIERLLVAADPRARNVACLAINHFNSWQLRFSKGVRSRKSLDPEAFTDKMVEGLTAMLHNKIEPLWNVDRALLALAVASQDQIVERLDLILPWLEHEEWWLNESATLALSPAMTDLESMRLILPKLIDSMVASRHHKGRGVMSWALRTATEEAGDAVASLVSEAFLTLYKQTPVLLSAEDRIGLKGITSCFLEADLRVLMGRGQKYILEAAEQSIRRLDDMRERELALQIDAMVSAADRLDEAEAAKLGKLLVEHYRPIVAGDDHEALKQAMVAGNRSAVKTMNKLLQIDRMVGRDGGWQLFGADPGGSQTWYHGSFDPKDKPAEDVYNRYRDVVWPDRLQNWFKPDYDPETAGWIEEKAEIGDIAPKWYQRPDAWEKGHLKKAGEVVFCRKRFSLDSLDFAKVRVTAFAKQGYRIYLNGHLLTAKRGRSRTWAPRRTYLDDESMQYLKKGRNVIAAMSFLEYFRGKRGNIEVYVEGLKDLPPLALDGAD